MSLFFLLYINFDEHVWFNIAYEISTVPLTTIIGSHLYAGGRDTAGLGGKGGPYRLDAGHNVYQVSQAEKDAVPEEIRRAALEMAEKAFKDRSVALHTENTQNTC